MPEFQFNLAFAKAVKPVLERMGFTVLMIGDHGDMTYLRARTWLANNADFFCRCITIRCSLNTCPGGAQKGNGKLIATCFRVFLYSSLALLRRRHPPFMRFRDWRVCDGGGYKPTEHHAEAERGKKRQFVNRVNCVYYFDDLLVLKTASQPAVLLESGIIVNRADELKLLDAATRNAIAEAVDALLYKCLQPASSKLIQSTFARDFK